MKLNFVVPLKNIPHAALLLLQIKKTPLWCALTWLRMIPKNNFQKSTAGLSIAGVKFSAKERESVSSIKREILVGLKKFIKQRFADTDSPVIECIKLFDPRI